MGNNDKFNNLLGLFNSLLKKYEDVLKKYLLETSTDSFKEDRKTIEREIKRFTIKKDFIAGNNVL